MAQDVPFMRQVKVDKLEKESLGASLLEVTEVTRLVGSVVVQVGIAIFGSSVFLGNPLCSGFDLRLKAGSPVT